MANIIDPMVLNDAKNELLNKVKKSMDMATVKKILEDQYNLEIGGDCEIADAELVIHNERIAFKMDFEIVLSLPVLFDIEGNYLSPEETSTENIQRLGEEAKDIIEDL